MGYCQDTRLTIRRPRWWQLRMKSKNPRPETRMIHEDLTFKARCGRGALPPKYVIELWLYSRASTGVNSITRTWRALLALTNVCSPVEFHLTRASPQLPRWATVSNVSCRRYTIAAGGSTPAGTRLPVFRWITYNVRSCSDISVSQTVSCMPVCQKYVDLITLIFGRSHGKVERVSYSHLLHK